MFRNVIAVLGLLALLAGPALAQETEWKWTTDGKRWTRTEVPVQPFVMPTTKLVPAAAGEEGAFLGFKYEGKQMQRVWFKEVPLAPEMAKAHECTWKLVYEKKAVFQKHLCVMNGAEKACCGMNAAGECLGMK
jgi:hypothetical protein